VQRECIGNYRKGNDKLIVDAGGKSVVFMEDLAVALLDEAEAHQRRRERFTVAY
jgi:putative NADH-flavin reductase